MQVLLIGSGGREHALAWKLSQSPLVTQIYCSPGNAGIRLLPKCQLLPLAPTDIEGLLRFATVHGIGLTVVGPELPLVEGIVDHFQAAGLPIFGPTAVAAQLEGSKAWAKQVMQEANIPTASYAIFQDISMALQHLQSLTFPVVIKADGLAAGKGVVVAQSYKEGQVALEAWWQNQLFTQGKPIIIEEFIQGEEVSVLAFTDGQVCLPMLPVQDHKRIGVGDTGPNTGGMGAYGPAHHLVSEALMIQIQSRILDAVITTLQKRGICYQGVLYAGLMISAAGDPYVLEFNCRFGDPETQVLMALLATPLEEILLACIQKRLLDINLQWHPGFAACVVLASQGYPDTFERGKLITGLPAAAESGSLIFHAGTRLAVSSQGVDPNQVLTDGGRVLGVTGRGDTLQAALAQAYQSTQMIQFEGVYYRTDIGSKALQKS
jgi:phosphoribosylamine--glycine ligase